MISNDYFRQFSELQTQFLRPMTRYNEIATRMTEELTSNSIRTFTKVLEEYQNGFKAYSEVKKIEDLLAVNTALTDKTANDLIEGSQRCSQILVEAISDMGKLMKENYEKVSEKVAEKAINPVKQTVEPFKKAGEERHK